MKRAELTPLEQWEETTLYPGEIIANLKRDHWVPWNWPNTMMLGGFRLPAEMELMVVARTSALMREGTNVC